MKTRNLEDYFEDNSLKPILLFVKWRRESPSTLESTTLRITKEKIERIPIFMERII
ncbi:MAG: hypothetical protein NZ929_04225 [Aigarchaeota archaeon]|nr:hypothetical protein [Aigarchaeota archaeon]MDW7985945.1 hypothetical protein [Nitrososphaerota archaeon]